jgi:mediator of RNA polymerase II transcription subunit 23
MFSHMLDWLLSWNPRQQNRVDEHDSTKIRKFDSDSFDWLHSCLAVVWALVDEERCRIPFYELLHSGIQFVDNVPDHEALFALILEIHRSVLGEPLHGEDVAIAIQRGSMDWERTLRCLRHALHTMPSPDW